MFSQVSFTLTGRVNATGSATATYTVPPDRGGTVRRLSASGTGALIGELRVLRNGIVIDASGAPFNDQSETVLQLRAGDQIVARWTGCAAGATMTLTFED